MSNNQSFKSENTKTDIVYYTHALTVDDFDLAITEVPNDEYGTHGKVEIVFFQNKGNSKKEVVAAVNMQLYELDALLTLAKDKAREFKKVFEVHPRIRTTVTQERGGAALASFQNCHHAIP